MSLEILLLAAEYVDRRGRQSKCLPSYNFTDMGTWSLTPPSSCKQNLDHESWPWFGDHQGQILWRWYLSFVMPASEKVNTVSQLKLHITWEGDSNLWMGFHTTYFWRIDLSALTHTLPSKKSHQSTVDIVQIIRAPKLHFYRLLRVPSLPAIA